MWIECSTLVGSSAIDVVLYSCALHNRLNNCAGCHGDDGKLGPATPLNNPEYQALIDDSTLSDIIENGQKGTLLPSFAEHAGGTLSDKQVSAVVKGIRAKWSKGNVLQGLNPPPYKSDRTGDADHGRQVYEAQCARCHGHAGGAASSVYEWGENLRARNSAHARMNPEGILNSTTQGFSSSVKS